MKIESAQAEIAARGEAPVQAATRGQMRTSVVPYAKSFTGLPAAWRLILVFLALLLVPPCANIAILIYARNVSRQQEFAARFVLGANRARIVGQLLIEASVLAAVAGGVGLLLAQQSLEWMLRVDDDQRLDFPFWMKPNISFETVLYVAALAAFAAMIAGGLPALKATRQQPGFAGLGSSRTSARLGMTWTALVVLQVALSTAVLPRAGEQIWYFVKSNFVGRGFASEEYVTARIVLDEQSPGPRLRDLQADLVRRVKAEIGVPNATVSAWVDGDSVGDEASTRIETDAAGQDGFAVRPNYVDQAYFDVFEAPMIAGRAFEAADFNPGRPVVVVNRSLAETLFGKNPIGKRLRYVGRSSDSEARVWHEIVGVVDEMSLESRARVYHPLGPMNAMSLTFKVGPAIPPGMAGRLLGITRSLDPNLQMEQFRTLADLDQEIHLENNLFGSVMATLMLVVLLFSAAGIHTLVAFTVSQRRREVGIRSALGAQPLRLVADLFRRDLAPVVIGGLVGPLLAIPIDRLGGTDIVSVSAFSVSLAVVFMIAIGLVAVAGPAHRALRIDAIEALRES